MAEPIEGAGGAGWPRHKRRREGRKGQHLTTEAATELTFYHAVKERENKQVKGSSGLVNMTFFPPPPLFFFSFFFWKGMGEGMVVVGGVGGAKGGAGGGAEAFVCVLAYTSNYNIRL